MKDEDYKKNLFDVSDIELQKFAWINTATLPEKRPRFANPFNDLYPGPPDSSVQETSILWNILNQGSIHENDLPTIIQFSIKCGNVPPSQVIQGTKELIEEIHLRNQQFLEVFTTLGNPQNQMEFDWNRENYYHILREEEHSELHRWFILKLQNNLSPEASVSNHPNVLHLIQNSLSEFQMMIFSYLNQDKNDKLLGEHKFRFFFNSKRKGSPFQISEIEAMKTKVAIHILGEYYKSKNKEKWKFLFDNNDTNFLKIFSIIKMNNFHSTPSRTWEFSSRLEKFEILPWNYNQKDYSSCELKQMKTTLLKKFNDFNWKVVKNQLTQNPKIE
ncbi:hypothetical protein PGT21_006201 [Puccinia graminis f. sp. tritici]|uniref:Uncharacterized protein n=1 Tax=Puccinia graminis f. sp. tritici TaxID=56615 RepID=A0A5B0QI75_PUCGR|nr:hypothetical protein PGT21_006201 [Puccinia graminis f. sp. tritici]